MMGFVNAPPPDSYDKAQIVRESLGAGADPNALEIPPETPALGSTVFGHALGAGDSWDYWAREQIDTNIVRELIKGGAKVDEPLPNGWLPLSYVVANPVAFKMLLDVGANPRKSSSVIWLVVPQSGNGDFTNKIIKESIIHKVAAFGNPDCLQLLLTRGFSINERDSEGDTPLHRAVDAGNLAVIEYLLKQKANVLLTNSAGESVVDVAAKRLNVAFVRKYDQTGHHQKILADYPGNPKSPAVGKWALESGSTNLFLQLEPQGGGEVSYFWRRPLAWKASDKTIEIWVMFPTIPRRPFLEAYLGWLEYDSKTDTCSLRWREGPQPSAVKLVRMR
jgi:hypothetical protein